VSEGYCWGIFRESAHSPGRETDDSEIMRLTGKHLEARGFRVLIQSPEEVTWPLAEQPRGVFFMCERLEILGHLRELSTQGVPLVNAPEAVLNTYRDRMIALLEEAGVAFVPSRLISTAADEVTPDALPLWVKRGDVHNTQEGDVTFATSVAAVTAALAGLAARGITQAVLQPHVEGDLVKFYGIGGNARPDGTPAWFRSFYHKNQTLRGYPLDPVELGRAVRRAAAALGLEVYGGDAIATQDGRAVLLDLNAWPSFALFREEAAERIAEHLARRFTGAGSGRS
jgi:glutathione synthase/RimK-type ligase-like ATP-grasp enzyme